MDKPTALHAVNAHQVFEQYIYLDLFTSADMLTTLNQDCSVPPLYKCAHMNRLFTPMLSVLRYFAGVACS